MSAGREIPQAGRDATVVEKRVREILAGIAGVEPYAIDRAAPLLGGGLELDSLSAAALVAAVEREYRIDLLEQDLNLSALESLASLVKFISGDGS